MPDPINEQIVQDILATLATVTAANTYSFNAVVRRDEPKLGVGRVDGLVLVSENDEDMLDNPPMLRHEWMKSMTATVFAVGEDGASVSLRDTANLRAADIIKALRVDPHRSTLAVDTIIRPPSPVFPDDGGYFGVAVNFDVQYRTDENDPYTQG